MGNLPSITLYQSVFAKIEHSALLYVGFQKLAYVGDINFTIRRQTAELSRLVATDDLVVCGSYESAVNTSPLRFVVDLRDRCDTVNEALLVWTDVYFKRSLQFKKQAGNNSEMQNKLAFYGLNFAARDSFFGKDSIYLLANLMSTPVSLALSRIKAFVSLPPLPLFEQSASATVSRSVLFQTRVWTASDVPKGDSEALNEKRVNLVKALRQQFGLRFQGGLVPTPLALSRYPELISPLHPKRRSYANLAKRNLVGVYSEGLSDSTAFKFLEYVAASQCIVAETIANQLPEECVEGVNYIGFDTIEGCIIACERLISEKKCSEVMRKANERLYLESAGPLARAKAMLKVLGAFKQELKLGRDH
jgi:hypothetical protein